jgi:uncharacterized protein YydD (DUF2326 family)
MYLKKLKIEEGSRVIREINFRAHLNLIVDETSVGDEKASGNNVGKTTVLRLIDFCLGSDGTNIWTDPEFKSNSNTTIEDFLKLHDVFVTLTLAEDLADESSQKIEIRRNFQSRSKKVILVNGEPVKSKDFPEILKPLIFGSNQAKPTFRQIIAKNIRDDKSRLQNTVKVLHTTTTREEYEALYLFWLGVDIDVASRKQKLNLDRKAESNLQTRLKRDYSLSQIKQSLIVIERSIAELESKRDSFSLNPDYEHEVEELNVVKSRINYVSSKIGRLGVRKTLINESAEELSSERVQIDTLKIKKIYEEAKRFLPELQKTFEQTLSFHNGMVTEKLNFIMKEMPELSLEILGLEREQSRLLVEELTLTESLKKQGAFSAFQNIVTDVNAAFEKKGNLEEQLRLWTGSVTSLAKIDEELGKIDKGIESLDESIQEKVASFNEIFSAISEDLYEDAYILSADKNEVGYELTVSSLMSNPGTGRKKGEIAAFDCAYIRFADQQNIRCLHFVLQDQIENVHDNQITKIFLDIVQNSNCQFVLPVLRDKLPGSVNVGEYEVLSLSQGSKLFRV